MWYYCIMYTKSLIWRHKYIYTRPRPVGFIMIIKIQSRASLHTLSDPGNQFSSTNTYTTYIPMTIIICIYTNSFQYRHNMCASICTVVMDGSKHCYMSIVHGGVHAVPCTTSPYFVNCRGDHSHSTQQTHWAGAAAHTIYFKALVSLVCWCRVEVAMYEGAGSLLVCP